MIILLYFGRIFAYGWRRHTFTPIEATLEVLSSRYGLAIRLDQQSRQVSDRIGFARSVSYDTTPYSEAVVPVSSIRRELGLYPPQYIRSLNLKRIKIVRNLSESSYGGQIKDIGAIPVIKQGFLYLNDDGDPLQLIQSIHHELSHFTDGDISPIWGRRKRKEWVELNPKGAAAYKVVPDYISDRSVEGERPQGFVSLYGTFSPEEDRAQVASVLMTMARAPGDYLKRLMERDKVLGAKVLATIAGIRQRSGTAIRGTYLEDLQSKKVDEDYWDSKTA